MASPTPSRPAPEELAEIFARELYVYTTCNKKASRILTRRRWYLGIKAGIREQYRAKAAELLASLRESDVVLASARPAAAVPPEGDETPNG